MSRSSAYRATRGYENCQKRIYDGVGEYNIPALEPVTYLPNVESWISFNKTRTVRRMYDKGVHFFIDDYQFQRVWDQPDSYVDMLAHYAAVCTPDFSPYSDFPKVIQLYNHYRKHWLGAYWQEHGITVIPTITWSSPDTLEWAFDGEPVGGIVALSSVGMFDSTEHRAWLIDGYEMMLDVLMPTKVLWKGKVPDELKDDERIIVMKSILDDLHKLPRKKG